jgi:nucleotide-binding universal stress UspA family protein
VGSNTTRQPPCPGPADRARTIATRGGRAIVLRSGADDADRTEPHLHHVHADGTVTVLLADDHPLVAQTRRAERCELAAMVELADRAPVALREPVRGLLWITGWLRVLTGEPARQEVLAVAEANPDSRLLDVGHGVTALRLVPASLVLADGDGTSSLRPVEFGSAEPDPFCRYEDHWLRHLELAHRDVVGMLTRLLPEQLRGGHIRPLGLDRFGLRLRIETPDADHDVRLAFSEPVDTPGELGTQLRRMVGCPFLADQRS